MKQESPSFREGRVQYISYKKEYGLSDKGTVTSDWIKEVIHNANLELFNKYFKVLKSNKNTTKSDLMTLEKIKEMKQLQQDLSSKEKRTKTIKI